MGLEAYSFPSERKAIKALKIYKPDFVVTDFVYGYGNNYAGVNVSNLDVFFYSLQKEVPQVKKIILVEKAEQQYVEKLQAIFLLESVLNYPVSESTMQQTLETLGCTA